MDREKILNMSQKENQVYDEREQAINTKSSAIAKRVGHTLCVLMVALETVFLKRPPITSMALFFVCECMEAIEAIYRYVHLKTKFNLIRSIMHTVFGVAFLIALAVLLCKGY